MTWQFAQTNSHFKLRDSLLRWYRFVDSLEPGRVVFGLRDTGITPDKIALGPRYVRSGADLFDALMRALPD